MILPSKKSRPPSYGGSYFALSGGSLRPKKVAPRRTGYFF